MKIVGATVTSDRPVAIRSGQIDKCRISKAQVYQTIDSLEELADHPVLKDVIILTGVSFEDCDFRGVDIVLIGGIK